MIESSAPSVVAIVLNWNNYEDSVRCLSSVLELEYPNLDVVLVDNGSSDDSRERLVAEFPHIEHLESDHNQGFSGGMNLGIRAALDRHADYVWLLNNDTIVRDTDTIEKLVETMEEDPDIGILSPLIYRYPDEETVWFWSGHINWRNGSAGHNTSPRPNDREIVDNEYIPLCAALIRRSVFDEIGLLPEDYFLYYEDVETCVRATEAGYRLVTDCETEVYHVEGGSSGPQLGALFSYYRARNALLFTRRFPDRIQWHLFPVYYPAWFASQFYHRVKHRELSGIKGMLHGVVDGILGRDGRGPYP